MNMQSLFRKLISVFAGKMNSSSEEGVWIILDMVSKHRMILVSLLVIGVVTGFIEGASIGLIAFSVVIITGETGVCPSYLMTLSNYLPMDLCSNYNKYDFFIAIVLLSIVVQVLKALINYSSSFVGIVLSTRVGFEMRSSMIRKFVEISYEDSSAYSAGEKQLLINQAINLSGLVTIVNRILVVVFILATYIAMMVSVNWQLSLLSLVFAIVSWFYVPPLLKKIREIATLQSKHSKLLNKVILDYLYALRLIKVYGRDERVMSSIDQTMRQEVGLRRLASLYSSALAPIQETLATVTAALILILSFYLTGEKAEEFLPNALAFVLILYRCNGQISSINDIRAQLSRSVPFLGMVAEFLNSDVEYNDRSNGVDVADRWSEISLVDVSYQYKKSDQVILKGINLTLEREKTYAIVGSSGAGKSTLVDLIIGLLKPSKGTLSIDGENAKDISVDSWVNQFSVVSQNDVILNSSVRDNLLFANEDATEEEMFKAANIANAHEFIMDMDNGYDSMLGEKGYKVSGGQIQRIAFARAILKDAPVLILDEATSALDTITEQKIVDALASLEKKKTVVLIAHRLSTVLNADKIIVLDKGAIADIGSHDELIVKEGLYKKMWNIQNKVNK